MSLWFLSFVDPERDVFLGSVVVKGVDEAEALTNSWKCGANPGGQVAMVELPPGVEPPVEVGRFYPLAEMLALGHVSLEDLGPNTRRAAENPE